MSGCESLPRRHSIRYIDWDYSQSAAYFLTLVCHNRANLFGEIKDGVLKLNHAGEIILSAWVDLENRFESVELGEFIVMPNHVHGILIIQENQNHSSIDMIRAGTSPAPTDDEKSLVGAALVAVRSDGARAGTSPAPTDDEKSLVGAALVAARSDSKRAGTSPAPTNQNPTLGNIIGAFKSISTHEYILAVRRGELPPFPGKIWQRNYYDHIIRSEAEMNRIYEYIHANPSNWEDDPENTSISSISINSLKILADKLYD